MRQRLALVTLLVADYNAARSFFMDALGFELVEDTPQADGRRWLVVRPQGGAGTGLLLAQASDGAQRAALGRQTGGRVALFLETDDFARDHAAFLARGVRFREAPRHEPYGTVAVFEDCCGNPWDLIQPASDERIRGAQPGVQAP